MIGQLKKKLLSSASFLVGAIIFSNVIGLLYNSYLGKELSFTDFGLIALINTLLTVSNIVYGAVSSTVNHQVAYLTARFGKEAGTTFHDRIIKKSIPLVLALSLVWIIFTPALTHYFNLKSPLLVWAFLPAFFLGLTSAISGGFIRGRFLFYQIGLFNIFEATVKILLAFIFVKLNYQSLTYLSIPIALSLSWLVILAVGFLEAKKTPIKHLHNYRFSKSFFTAAVFTGLSTNVFLTFDILLTKHYFTAVNAGMYAFLSLIGKMIFFFGSLLNIFLISFVSRDEGAHRDPNKNFYVIFGITSALTLSACIGLNVLGPVLLPFLFGSKALQIIQYLIPYSIAVGLYTVTSSVITFHLARRHYFFSVVSLIVSAAMIIGIINMHRNITDIVNVILTTSIINFSVILALHLIQKNGGFFLSNILDLYELFRPLPKLNYTPLGKRILIFNWRDTKHVFAGGAEVYVHELAKRWVKEGNSVALFCGNDEKSARFESIDGVNVIRRGGFYTVYFWAMIYYIFRLRGKFDLIIDCENGIPFFTPLYAKEKKYLLIHHVHQEVFRKSLIWPLSSIASYLEIKLMPYAYQNTQIITVSPSTKKEIVTLNLTKKEPVVIYNGVDSQFYNKGTKSKVPTVLYLGRLQYYKSINVFIRVAKQLSSKFPNANFLIAGEGEELSKLKAYATRIQSPVTFVGRVSEKKKVSLLQEAWVVVNPSSVEGWGLTVIEANACGTPVVASNVSGLKDSVRNGTNGYLVEHGNVKMFSEKITTLLANSKLRRSMSSQARRWSLQFDWTKSATQFLSLINNQVSTVSKVI
jgi:glycosyltransferase involved in cell wall biosynthesis